MSFCTRCGEYAPTRHACPPEWVAWSPDYDEREEDARQVFASVAYLAAEKFAEQFDAVGDYPIIRGNDAKVMVRLAEGGPVHEFVVSGESVPSYSAREISRATKETSRG